MSEHKISMGREGMQHWTRPDLFNATSPLEEVELVISEAPSSNQKRTVLSVTDVRKAYFYAKGGAQSLHRASRRRRRTTRQQAVWAAEKACTAPVTLLKTGECELGVFLEEIGLRRGQASTCMHSEEARGISASVHADDVAVKASSG